MPECLRHRLCAVALALLSFVLVPIVMERLTPIDEARADSRPIASLADIRRLAAEAYVWGLGPQFTWRFAKYNTTINAPINALTYGENPAAWNNSATNAGNSSLIYINGFMDFSSGTELVLTVPPSRNQYYVVNYLDDYINTFGSIGMRTTPSDVSQSYLLVGPNSRFANKKVATIGGHTLPVMASDTNCAPHNRSGWHAAAQASGLRRAAIRCEDNLPAAVLRPGKDIASLREDRPYGEWLQGSCRLGLGAVHRPSAGL